MQNTTTRVAVVCRNKSGEPDIFIAVVTCSSVQYQNGDHYEMAETQAEEAGYEAQASFDEHDSSWRMFKEMSSTIAIRVAVACDNSGGEREIYSTIITCTPDQYANGEHYEMAETEAEEAGRTAHFSFDENDPAWKSMGLIAQADAPQDAVQDGAAQSDEAGEVPHG